MELVEACRGKLDPFDIFVALRVVGPLTESDLAPLKPCSLHLDDLSVFYGERCALSALSGTFQSGTLTAIVGPNGGGKSTLLKAIMGQVPYEGRLTLEDATPKDIAYLPQHSPVDRTFPLCVGDVVSMGLCHKGGFYQDLSYGAKDLIEAALASVNLPRSAHRFLHTLSGGQFQKVLFARLSVQNAPIILLDEPFAAVDAHTTQDLMAQITNWQTQGRTLLVVSHDMDLVRTHFSHTLILAREAVAWGPTQDVLTLDALHRANTQFCEKEPCNKRKRT